MWEPENYAEFERAYLAGCTNDDLARIFSTTSDKADKFIRKARDEMGWPARKDIVGTDAAYSPILNDENTEASFDIQVLTLVKKSGVGTSIPVLADQLDVSPKKVREAIKRLALSHYFIKEVNDTVITYQPRSGGKSLVIPEYLNKLRTFQFGLIADTHLGSTYARLDVLNTLYDIFEQEGINRVYLAGNWIEGEASFNTDEVEAFGVDGQINNFLANYPRREDINTYILSGDDHEGWYTAKFGADVGAWMALKAKDIGRDDLHYIGYMEHDVFFKTPEGGATRVRIVHPGGGSAYAISYAPQKLIESIATGERPHILCCGHWHKAGYMNIGDVHCFLAGTTKAQDTFMRKRRLAAHMGGWIIHVTQAEDGTPTRVQSEFIPFKSTVNDTWSRNLEDAIPDFVGVE